MEVPVQRLQTLKASPLKSSGFLILLTDAFPIAASLSAQWPVLWQAPHFLQYYLQGTKKQSQLPHCSFISWGTRMLRTADESYENVAVSKYLATLTNSST